MRRSLLLIGILSILVGGCSREKSPAGFRLPDGDPTAGRAAFVELQCHACHFVDGVEMPKPSADPPVPAVLGGRVTFEPTDGFLVTSIINPSHRITAWPRAYAEAGGLSRMGDFTEVMTVRQLIDIVAFLHQISIVPAKEPLATNQD